MKKLILARSDGNIWDHLLCWSTLTSPTILRYQCIALLLFNLSFSPHPLTLVAHPLPLSPAFSSPQALAFSLACSISPPGKGKEMAATQFSLMVTLYNYLHKVFDIVSGNSRLHP